LLIADEIQTGMRRTGPWFAFQYESMIPDILVLGKGFGGGMPLGAFISSKENMAKLTLKPVLGHITTFGGHPVSCAAAISLHELLRSEELEIKISRQEKLFRKLLVHDKIKDLRGKGLFLCLEFENTEICQKVISKCIDKGLFTDWFLFAPHCMRIAPPLIILDQEIEIACSQILEILTSI
jgi:acetylornithine/succinyldiaminopimelate/putrescine aminotransferase